MGTTARRPRQDGWTAARQARFLDVLAMTGCVRDACRAVRLSSTSTYRYRDRNPAFAAAWDAALASATAGLEATAYRRAVEGVEVPVFHAGVQIGTTRRYSDALLRLLLQGAAPDRFGRTGGAPVTPAMMDKERIAKFEAAIEARVREEIRVEQEALAVDSRERLEARFRKIANAMAEDQADADRAVQDRLAADIQAWGDPLHWPVARP